jgi:hypothetical protein
VGCGELDITAVDDDDGDDAATDEDDDDDAVDVRGAKIDSSCAPAASVRFDARICEAPMIRRESKIR